MRRTKVYIVQPVIPHYRLSLFDVLACRDDFNLEVHASQTVQGAPASVSDLPTWGDLSHECVSLFAGQLFWQRGLRLPKGFGRGDVLVLNGNPRFLSSMLLAVRARRRGAGIIWWGHGWSPTSVQWRAAIRYRFMAAADVVLLSTADEVKVLADSRLRKTVVLGLNNTLDLTPMYRAMAHWTQERLSKFREEHALSEHKVLLFCGRLRSDPDTELHLAIRALSLLKEQNKRDSYLLIVIGAGDAQSRLQALARILSVNDRIRWQGSVYDEEELAPWFMSALCFVFPGSIGLGLLHAFAYGLPVVTHSERKLHGPEIAALRDDHNGLMFQKGSASDLCRQISRFASDGNLRDRLSAAAKHTVESDFSFDGMVKRFLEAIRFAADASRHRA